jgi:ribosome-associated protein
MQTLELTTATITLAQAIKLAGLSDSGGHAKQLVRDGLARVNGAVETQPGRKLAAGDRFTIDGGEEWVLQVLG